MKLTEEEEKTKNQESNKKGFFEKNGLLFFIVVALIAFGISYAFEFSNTKIGLYSLIIAIFSIVFVFILKYQKPSLFFGDDAKDPKYYYLKMLDYYKDIPPYMSMQLTWMKEHLYYPMANPNAIFLSLYDKLNQKSYIAFIKILPNGKMQVRGLLNQTWSHFVNYGIYKLIMQGFLSSKEGTITFMGKDGNPITIPQEALGVLKDRF